VPISDVPIYDGVRSPDEPAINVLVVVLEGIADLVDIENEGAIFCLD
jgi:hypothetical protein